MIQTSRLLVEATVVGLLLVVIFHVVFTTMDVLDIGCGTTQLTLALFISGALFHIGCQYTGVNDWYVRSHPVAS